MRDGTALEMLLFHLVCVCVCPATSNNQPLNVQRLLLRLTIFNKILIKYFRFIESLARSILFGSLFSERKRTIQNRLFGPSNVTPFSGGGSCSSLAKRKFKKRPTEPKIKNERLFCLFRF